MDNLPSHTGLYTEKKVVVYPMNIPNFHGRLYTVLIAFVCQLYCTANVLNKIPPFWLTSFALRGPGSFTHSLWSWGGCSMRGEARLLVSIGKHGSMHYAKKISFVLHKSTQEWCSVTFSEKTAERCQCTEERQWPASALLKKGDKQLRLHIQEKWPPCQQTGRHKLLLFYWSLEECATFLQE